MPNDTTTAIELVPDAGTGELMFSPTTALEAFSAFELCEGKDALFAHRLRIEEAGSILREYKAKLDDELIRVMKAENITEFSGVMRGKPAKIYFANEKKEEVVDSKRIKNMLHGNEGGNARDMAFRALSGSKSIWKTKGLRELADTLGEDQSNIIKTTWGDKVKVGAVDEEILERAKK